MFYFKRVIIVDADGDKVEAALRKAASKRHTSLDLQSSSLPIGTDKLLLGLEKENVLYFTRYRSHIHLLFPKLIVRFDKNRGFTEYKIRYGFLSFLLGSFLFIVFLLNCYYAIISSRFEDEIISIAFFLGVFLVLTSVELKLTEKKIKKIIDAAA